MHEGHPSGSLGEPPADEVEDAASSDNLSHSLRSSMGDRRGSIATVTDADGDENYTRSLQIREEMKIVSQEHNWYREQLAKDTQKIQDLILAGRDKYKFVEDSKMLLNFWDRISPRSKVCMRIFKDSVKHARISGHNSAHPTVVRSGYWLDLPTHSHSDQPPSKLVLTFTAPSKQYTASQEKAPSENGQLSTQSASSTSSSSTLIKAFRGHKDFSSLIFNTPNEAADNADLPVNDAEFMENILPLLAVGEPNTSHRETIMQFFRQYTLSDDARRLLWKTKISNSLGLNSETYECLKMRLKEDGLPRSITKVINDDLLRTLPQHKHHSAGATMLEAIRELLSLWHIYRPDIGYVQGMSYLMVMLYYYFEDFQCFALFANLIINRDILYHGYTFDLHYVELCLTQITALQKVLDDKLAQKCPAVAAALSTLDISTEVFLVDWIFTCFTRACNLKVSRVIWDLWLTLGDYYLLRISYALFALQEKDLSSPEAIGDGLKFIRTRTTQLRLSALVRTALRENKTPAEFQSSLKDKLDKPRLLQ